MDYFAGLDLTMDETHVCVFDREGAVIHESKSASLTEAIAAELAKAPGCRRIASRPDAYPDPVPLAATRPPKRRADDRDHELSRFADRRDRRRRNLLDRARFAAPRGERCGPNCAVDDPGRNFRSCRPTQLQQRRFKSRQNESRGEGKEKGTTRRPVTPNG